MRVTIKSDGEPLGTIVTTEDGVDLSDRISGVSFSHDSGELPRLNLYLGLTPLVIEGYARMIGPDGRQVRRIEYVDGSAETFAPTAPVEFTPLGTGRTRKFRIGTDSGSGA